MRRYKYFIVLIFLFQSVNLSLYAQKIDVYSRPVQVERSHDYDALHYRAEFHFDMDAKKLYGRNEMTIRPL
ncbi:MAG: hypothetical protein U9N72_02855, partial [Bacteroidota bacterium]|nr:hypothetical protein [Bacteroidota bacterium]